MTMLICIYRGDSMYGISLAKTEKEIERVIVHEQCFTARNALLIYRPGRLDHKSFLS